VSSLAPLPVAIPLIAAAVLMGLGHWVPVRLARLFAVVVSLSVLVLCAVLVVGSRHSLVLHWFGGWRPEAGVALGVSFAIDQFGAAGATLAALIVLAAVVTWLGSDELDAVGLALVMTTLAAAVGFCLTGDIFNLFVFFELMSVSVFGLVAIDASHVGAIRGALQMAVSNSVGAFFVLMGIALLYARTGALNLAQMGNALTSRRSDQLVVTALVLIAVGFLVKAAVVPFHFWLADAAGTAPAPVAMLLVGMVDSLGLYAVARIYWTVFSGISAPHIHALRLVLLVVAGGTALLGAALAWEEARPRRRLAYVSISHTGLMLLGVALLDPNGLAGFGVYAVADGATKAALFAAAHGADHPKHPRPRAAALVLGVGALALAGLPPFATALGKGLIEHGASTSTRPVLLAVLWFSSTLTAAAVIGMALEWWNHPMEAAQSQSRGWGWAAVSGALLAVVAAWGVVPGVARAAVRAADGLTNRAAYAAAVLATPAAGTRPRQTPTPGLGVEPLLLGLAAVLVATGLAVERRRRVSHGHEPSAVMTQPWTILKSRSIGDAVTWLTVGTALLGAGVTLAFR